MKRTGAIIERPDLYKYLSALENLRIFAVLSGIRVTQEQLIGSVRKSGIVRKSKQQGKNLLPGNETAAWYRDSPDP